MQQVISATFENGLLKPDQALDLPPQARVRRILEFPDNNARTAQSAWDELEKLAEETQIDSGGNF